MPVEEKESIRWVESLIKSNNAMSITDTEVISVCDREVGMYDFFEAAYHNKALVLVRACRHVCSRTLTTKRGTKFERGWSRDYNKFFKSFSLTPISF